MNFKTLKWKSVMLLGRIKGNKYLLKLLKRKYFITFTEEFWMGRDKKFESWVEGRLEIYDNFGDSPYAIKEIRFCNNADDWYKFREKWDFRDITEKKLVQVVKLIQEKYFINPHESN